MKVYHFLEDGLAERMFENFIRYYGVMVISGVWKQVEGVAYPVG